ncbi:MAG: PepSY-like domain-containing protein, partial [Alistipes sp.]|nr:PepSY-like domain-containing protein [Alistipes sp.]
VDCKYGQVPSAIVPKQILKYLSSKYPDVKVVKIERLRKGFEVSLSNRIELEFDQQFRVVDIDD